jgi:hypothetical protein
VVLGHAEQRRERDPQVVRHLRRRPDRHPVLARLEACHDAAALDRMRAAAMLEQGFLEHMRRALEGLAAVAIADLEPGQKVRPFQSRPRRGRIQHRAAVRDRRQGFVID